MSWGTVSQHLRSGTPGREATAYEGIPTAEGWEESR